MNILITSLNYPGIVGVSTYIDQLKKGLISHGHHVDLFSFNPFIIPSNPNKSLRSQIYVSNYQKAVAKIPFEHYDIIHPQGIIPIVAVSQVKPQSIPCVITLHGALTFNLLLNKNITMHTPAWRENLNLESKAITSSDICIVPSNWLKDLVFNEYKVPQNQQISIVPYGIDKDEFDKKLQMTPSIVKPKNKFVIACTARLVPLKGHQYLLDSLAKLKRLRKDWVCWLIGDGPLRNQLKQQVQTLSLGNYVRFLGNQHNVPALLKEADLFVFPSLLDTLPFAVMEAQLAGVPVCATDAGGIPEMINNGVTGLISPKRNSLSLYENIKKLMENQQLRTSLSNNAKNFAVEQWSINKMIENTISVYESILK